MICDAGTDHFHAPDFSILDEECLGHEDARRAVETSELVWPAIGKNTLIDGALIEDCMRPNHTAFLVDDRVPAVVNVLHDKVVPQLELR